MTDDFKKIGYILIPYITICSGLYHIMFWSNFNINGLSLINISDIIKSTIPPIYSTLVVIIYHTIMNNYVAPNYGKNKEYKKGISNKTLVIVYFSTVIVTGILSFLLKGKQPITIYIYGFINFVCLSAYFVNNDFFKSLFSSENNRRFFIDIIISLPIICALTGLYDSKINYENIEYKYIIIKTTEKNNILNIKSDTLKLVGIVEDFFIFSPLDNSTLIFRNKSDINNLVLNDYKK